MQDANAKPETTAQRWAWSRRIGLCGYHVAIQIGRISGLAVWPPGSWPKAPLVYCFIDCLRLKVMP